ncbi:MAG: hypothetical protein INR69_23285 [Mucilaginibacter polytrichastri]|nr:hypothetical protein [Mucilaginibacter polytrichastri]
MEKKVNLLVIYAMITTTVMLFLLFSSFRPGAKEKFSEIDVERINVVEKNGTLRLVIANKTRQHPGAMDGKTSAPRERDAGLIFFNDEGDECGGLVYGSNKKEAGMVYSVDQYKNDQIMQLQYAQENGKASPERSYGLRLWDRRDDFGLSKLMTAVDSIKKKGDDAYKQGIDEMVKEGKLGRERLFVGKNWQNEVGLFIRDDKGQPRIRLYVDKNNVAKLEVLDEKGKAIPLSEYH